MSFRSPVDRITPDRLADERGSLSEQLDFHRATLLRKLDGLDDDSLRRPMTASGLSLLGLVKHLAVTEHGWFIQIFGGVTEPNPFAADPGQDVDASDADFRVGPDETADDVVGHYLEIIERAKGVVAGSDLDDVVTTPSGARANLRAIMIHMIQETARHNGHADIIRESIDGRTGH